MTNKEYKNARETAENADALYAYEKWNGFSIYPTRYMNADELKELRAEYKADKENGAFTIDGLGDRAVILPTKTGLVLKSYQTKVVALCNGEFVKLWDGFSVTTLKHVNALRANGGLSPLTKRAWIEMPTAEYIGGGEYVNPYTGEIFKA